MDCKVGFIGFGLIAGSIAHALRESGNNYNIIATSSRDGKRLLKVRSLKPLIPDVLHYDN